MVPPLMTDLIEIKKTARSEAKARRKVAKAAHPDAADSAMRHFLENVEITPGAVVSAYRPIFSELDVSPLMLALHERGVKLCVPVIDGADMPLSFRVWTPESTMIVGAFGAEIPEEAAETVPNLLIAPMLSFDRRIYRLGYGGGFYDRTLEKLRAAGGATAIGYAYAAQEVAEVPIEPTDQRLDGVVTEAGIIRVS